jgi:hypothetical protein
MKVFELVTLPEGHAVSVRKGEAEGVLVRSGRARNAKGGYSMQATVRLSDGQEAMFAAWEIEPIVVPAAERWPEFARVWMHAPEGSINGPRQARVVKDLGTAQIRVEWHTYRQINPRGGSLRNNRSINKTHQVWVPRDRVREF